MLIKIKIKNNNFIMTIRKNNREKILETSRKLLPKYGYNGISIRSIAAESDLTTGAIYFHFKNKKEIYKTICFEAIDLLVDKFKKGIENRKTPSEKLIAIFDSYIDFYYNNREYYNILMEYKAEYDSTDSVIDKEFTEKFREMAAVSENTTVDGTEQGIFKNVNPLMLSIFLAALTEGIIQYKKLGLFDQLNIDDKDFRTFMTDVVGYGIMKKK